MTKTIYLQDDSVTVSIETTDEDIQWTAIMALCVGAIKGLGYNGKQLDELEEEMNELSNE